MNCVNTVAIPYRMAPVAQHDWSGPPQVVLEVDPAAQEVREVEVLEVVLQEEEAQEGAGNNHFQFMSIELYNKIPTILLSKRMVGIHT